MRLILAWWLSILLTVCCCAQAYNGSQTPTRNDAIKRAYPSVFLVDITTGFMTSDNKLVMKEFVATSWSIASDGKDSILVTAGHACPNAGDTRELEDNTTLTVLASEVDIIDSDGKSHEAKVMLDDDTPAKDQCLLKVDFATDPLILANEEPEPGDSVFYVGYPNGQHAIQRGFYVDDTSDSFTNSSLMATGGASGSPEMNEQGQVYSMLVRVSTSYQGQAYGTHLDTLQPLVKAAYADLL